MSHECCPGCMFIGPGRSVSGPDLDKVQAFSKELAAFVKERRDEERAKRPPEIHYSDSRDQFYVVDHAVDRALGHMGSRFWLSVETFPATDETKARLNANAFLSGHQITVDGEDPYVRERRDFAFWKVRSGPTEEIGREDRLYKDYAVCAQWPDVRESAEVVTP